MNDSNENPALSKDSKDYGVSAERLVESYDAVSPTTLYGFSPDKTATSGPFNFTKIQMNSYKNFDQDNKINVNMRTKVKQILGS